MFKNFRKGVTLLELTIVMAVTAIIAVLIVSFCQLSKNYTISLSSQEVALTDLEDIKSMFELWTSSFDKEGNVIEICGSNDNQIQIFEDSYQYYLTFGEVEGEKTVYGFYPNEDNTTSKKFKFEGTSSITSFEFDFLKNDSNGLYILSLKIEYQAYSQIKKSDIETKEIVFLKSLRCASVERTAL